jgi:pimeloyl-ACP methyl ester carboxylesterase
VATKHIRRLDGRQLAYCEHGDPAGCPVFFFHGTPSSRLIHPPAAISETRGARIITVDRPGFGLSEFQPGRTLLDWPDDVVALADTLDLDRFSIAGPSGGGPYVAACAFKIPERISAAAMLGSGAPITAPGAKDGMTAMRRVAFLVGQNAPSLMRPLIWLAANPGRDPERFLMRFSAGLSGDDASTMADPETRAMFVHSYAESVHAGVRGVAHEATLFAQPWGFDLTRITIPVHIWHGEKDNSTPLAMGRYLAKEIPNAQPRFLPDTGHLFFIDRWNEILDVLLPPFDR